MTIGTPYPAWGLITRGTGTGSGGTSTDHDLQWGYVQDINDDIFYWERPVTDGVAGTITYYTDHTKATPQNPAVGALVDPRSSTSAAATVQQYKTFYDYVRLHSKAADALAVAGRIGSSQGASTQGTVGRSYNLNTAGSNILAVSFHWGIDSQQGGRMVIGPMGFINPNPLPTLGSEQAPNEALDLNATINALDGVGTFVGADAWVDILITRRVIV